MAREKLSIKPELCAYCDEPMDPEGEHYGSRRTKDHIIPRHLGIKGTVQITSGDISAQRGNGVYACGRCNYLKNNMLPAGLREVAEIHERRAALLRQMADRVEKLIKDRRLMP